MQYQHPTHNNTHRNTHSHTDVSSVFSSSFTFVGLLSLTQSWTQVLSTIDLSQLIDFCVKQLLCHCYVIVLRCFCSDLKITSPDFVWRVYTISYPVLTHRKSGTAATERDRNRDSHRKCACNCSTHSQTGVDEASDFKPNSTKGQGTIVENWI